MSKSRPPQGEFGEAEGGGSGRGGGGRRGILHDLGCHGPKKQKAFLKEMRRKPVMGHG